MTMGELREAQSRGGDPHSYCATETLRLARLGFGHVSGITDQECLSLSLWQTRQVIRRQQSELEKASARIAALEKALMGLGV